MSDAKHTGGWEAITSKASKSDPYSTAMVRIPGGMACADFTGSGKTAAEDRANATLAAAAPDLLAACEAAVVECLDNRHVRAGFDALIPTLRAAIAKAKGTR